MDIAIANISPRNVSEFKTEIEKFNIHCKMLLFALWSSLKVE